MSDQSTSFEENTLDMAGDDFDDFEVDDRLGAIEQHDDGDELILTRVPRDKTEKSFEVLRFDRVQKMLRFSPKATQFGQLKNQFARITELQIESPRWDPHDHSVEHGQYHLLYARGLPKGFSAMYEFGLGIKRDYIDLIRGIEKHTDCTVVCQRWLNFEPLCGLNFEPLLPNLLCTVRTHS